jgi:hypothetical protein
MTSPKFSLQGTLPSLYKSALISIGGVTLALIVLYGLKWYFPGYDFSTIEASIIFIVSPWLINLVKEFVSAKE